MAKYDLKFIANDDDRTSINVISEETQIVINIEDWAEYKTTICLDKSTAIKFAKTLRTEINKIAE